MKRIAGAAAALLVAALSACSGSSVSPELTPTPSATPTPATGTPGTSGRSSTGGLDVRYLDEDGTVKTVKVPSFPR